MQTIKGGFFYSRDFTDEPIQGGRLPEIGIKGIRKDDGHWTFEIHKPYYTGNLDGYGNDDYAVPNPKSNIDDGDSGSSNNYTVQKFVDNISLRYKCSLCSSRVLYWN